MIGLRGIYRYIKEYIQEKVSHQEVTDNGDSPSKRLKLVFIGIAAIVVLSPVILFFISSVVSYEFLDLMSVINGVASILLSLLLAYIYISLGGIQDMQTGILDNQEYLMRLQNLPQIKITSWGANDNEVEFTLANIGQGVANNISLGISEQPQNIEYFQNFRLRMELLYQDNSDSRKNFLNGKDTRPFIGPAVATTVVDNVQHWEFTRVIDHLYDKGEDEIEYIVTIDYYNLFEDKIRIDITSRHSEIKKGMTFEDALKDSSVTNTVARHIPTNHEIETYSDIDQKGLFFDPTSE